MTEFGSGVIVCLVKFSEHLGNRQAGEVGRMIRWINATPREREQIMESQEEDAEWKVLLALDEHAESSERLLDELLMNWAHYASDHLVELDREIAPASLCELADLTIDLRHPAVDGGLRGEEEWLRMLALWSEAALDIDERLGATPEWGEW